MDFKLKEEDKCGTERCDGMPGLGHPIFGVVCAFTGQLCVKPLNALMVFCNTDERKKNLFGVCRSETFFALCIARNCLLKYISVVHE